MLRNVTDLHGCDIRASDGVIGKVDDLYFDDEAWAIRYLVVDTGTWLSSRRVLISPLALGHPDWIDRMLPVSLTKLQVERSPNIDTQQPVSRQQEASFFNYYGYPNYWDGEGLWGMGAYPGGMNMEDRVEAEMKARGTRAVPDNWHVRSSRAVIGYHIHAADGDIGHVKDLLVDDCTWALRYLVVSTSNWWGGHDMLIATPWIEDVSWSDATVSVNLTRQAVKDAPPYDSAAAFDRQLEESIHEHYSRPGYWLTEGTQEAAAEPRSAAGGGGRHATTGRAHSTTRGPADTLPTTVRDWSE